jgi:SAM-dependent methyltransferase
MTTPRPSPAVLHAFYTESYYATYPMNQGDENTWLERGRSILRTAHSRARRVLDYGAGEGRLVHAFQKLGLDAHGVDASPAARERALRERGLNLDDRLPQSAPPFDLITFVHSLEHVPDPVGTLRGVASLLAADGRVFIEVPHAATIEMWSPKLRRDILWLPGHLYHFIPESLRKVVETAGLTVSTVRLSNPRLVEWAFGLRERWQRRTAGPTPMADTRSAIDPANRVPASDGRPRELWRSRALPWVRQHFPGAQFQVVATKMS